MKGELRDISSSTKKTIAPYKKSINEQIGNVKEKIQDFANMDTKTDTSSD